MVQRQRGPTINVLLVEDDEGLRKAVERGLTKAGYSVAAAGSGREALELVRTSTPDAVGPFEEAILS